MAVLRSVTPHPDRLLSESIALAEGHGSTVMLAGDFARDLVIAAERRGDNVTQMLKQIVAATGDQRAVLSSVGLAELVHGIYRVQTAQARSRRDSFIRELLTVRME